MVTLIFVSHLKDVSAKSEQIYIKKKIVQENAKIKVCKITRYRHRNSIAHGTSAALCGIAFIVQEFIRI